MDADLRFALHLADIADRLTGGAAGRTHGVDRKPDGTIVTAVDREVEAALRAEIVADRPGDAVLGEEFGAGAAPSTGGPARRQWVIDPLDQTVAYSRGLPEFASLIALRDGSGVACAVVSAPALGRRWWAVRGQGSWSDTGRSRVSDVDELGAAVVSLAAPQVLQDRHDALAGALALCRATRGISGNGGFLAHMRVAEGLLDVAVDPWGEQWDLAACSLVVTEAGGRFTTLDGAPDRPGRPLRGSAVVTNGRLHDTVLRHLTVDHHRRGTTADGKEDGCRHHAIRSCR